MSKSERVKNWHTPDTDLDTKDIKPPGEMLVGRTKPVELRRYSIRQREIGIAVNFYSRKHNAGIPSYGITVDPGTALEMAVRLRKMAEEMLRRKG